MPNNDHYLRRITPQHRHPKFMEWLAANLKPHLEAEEVLMGMDEDFDLDNARGKQLDVLGQIVGRSRVLSFDPVDGSSPILKDDIFELLIRAKISANQWDGTIPGVQALWENLFPEYQLIIHDNQNMTMDLYIVGLVSMLEMELMSRGYIAPKPMGVWINYTFVTVHPEVITDVKVAGKTFPVYSSTTLPPYVPEVDFEISIGAHAWQYSSTTLPYATDDVAIDAFLIVEDDTVSPGYLIFENDEVTPMKLLEVTNI